MEPIFVLPTTVPTYPKQQQQYEHPPILRQASMQSLQDHRREQLEGVFKHTSFKENPKYSKGRFKADTFIGTVANRAEI